MPTRKYPHRKERFILYLSNAEKRKVKEIMQHSHQPSSASTFRMMVDKIHAQLFPPITDKGE